MPLEKYNVEKDVLYELYLIKNLTMVECSEILGVPEYIISKFVKKYNFVKTDNMIKDCRRRSLEKFSMKKYGVKNISMAPEVKKKKEEKSLEKYGTKTTLQKT